MSKLISFTVCCIILFQDSVYSCQPTDFAMAKGPCSSLNSNLACQHSCIAMDKEPFFAKLFHACDNNHDKDLQNNIFGSLLHVAVFMDDAPMAKLLLEHEASPATTDKSGRSALNRAIIGKNISLVKMFLEHGVKPNHMDDTDTSPLQEAVRTFDGSDLTLISLLLDYKASPDLPRDSSPLKMAVIKGHFNAAVFLLDHGAYIDMPDKGGYTLLQRVVFARNWSEHKIAARFLVEHGADIHLPHGHVPHGYYLDSVPSLGLTPLLHAINKLDVDLINFLLDLGADPNEKDKHDIHPLHQIVLRCHSRGTACAYENELIFKNIIKPLLARGANVNAVSKKNTFKNKFDFYSRYDSDKICIENGETPLALAIRYNLIMLAELFLEHGADPNIADTCGNTPLHKALDIELSTNTYYRQHPCDAKLNFIKALLKCGADINRRDSKSKTARDLSIERKDSEIAALLDSWPS